VIGHSGHSRVWGRFLGDAASKIVGHARCAVLVVR
jgi:nucleotide-binding universal stress UspA family protein